MLVGAYLCYGLQSQSPTDRHLYACVGMDCNPRVQGTHPFLHYQQNESTPIPKMQKKRKFFFGPTPDTKMGSAKKSRKEKIIFAHFCPFWMLSQNFAYYQFKTPNEKLGFRESLGFARYVGKMGQKTDCRGVHGTQRLLSSFHSRTVTRKNTCKMCTRGQFPPRHLGASKVLYNCCRDLKVPRLKWLRKPCCIGVLKSGVVRHVMRDGRPQSGKGASMLMKY